MKPINLIFLVLVVLGACQTSTEEGTNNDVYFETKLGDDMLVIEEFNSESGSLEATAVVRSPQTSIRSYNIEFDSDGNLISYSSVSRNGMDTTQIQNRMSASWEGDSLVVAFERGDELVERKIASDRDVLPFIDMVHWPFDIALQRAYKSGADTYVQPMFSGRRVSDFEIRKLSEDSMTIKHPSRGIMGVTVDRSGKLLLLDAGQTTRKLKVSRKNNTDMAGLTAAFVQADRDGKSFGGLSGRGEFEGSVYGANIKMDFGQPVKRGRDIWGALVPYGARWRTGANRATHFSVDKDLMIEDLKVPAGDYTLFTIPEQDGGVLIINTQTGQNGRTYNEDLDLGRVAMAFRDLDSSVEVFTIIASETDNEGVGELRLQWDMQELVIPFTVIQ